MIINDIGDDGIEYLANLKTIINVYINKIGITEKGVEILNSIKFNQLRYCFIWIAFYI